MKIIRQGKEVGMGDTAIKMNPSDKPLSSKVCVICNEVDDFSEDCVCHNCIKKWKMILLKRRDKQWFRAVEKLKKCMIREDHVIDKIFGEFK